MINIKKYKTFCLQCLNYLRRIANEAHGTYLYFRPFIWFIFVNEFVFDFYMLEGESMLPTFDPYGNIVIVDKLTTNKFRNKLFSDKKVDYEIGEVVCLINPVHLEMKLCKRVIHKEGEEVILSNGNKLIVPKNHLWVEGDNKQNSMDSRRFGPVSKHLVLGRVPLQIWPKLKLL